SHFSWVFNNALFRFLLFLLFVIVSFTILRKYFLKLTEHFVRRTKNKWDDILFSKKVLNRTSYFIPAIIFHWCADWAVHGLSLSVFDHISVVQLKVLLVSYML